MGTEHRTGTTVTVVSPVDRRSHDGTLANHDTHPRIHRRKRTPMTTNTIRCDSPTEVMQALADPDSRAILATAVGGHRTAAELAERCGIPLSTTYRKVDGLVDLGLLAEKVRIRPGRHDAYEYRLRPKSIGVRITSEGELVAVCALEEDPGTTDPLSTLDEVALPLRVETSD